MAKKKEKAAAEALNDKQRAFCREYIIDFNQTQAAIRAGYAKKSANVTSSRLLTNANIQQEISRLVKERADRTDITADRVVEQLARIAFMDIKTIVDWGVEERNVDDGVEFKEINGKTEAFKKYRKEPYEYVRPKNPAEVDGTLIQAVKMGKHGFIIEIPDRMRALEMLAKHTGVFDDRPQTTVDVGSYVKALWDRTAAGDIWDGFNNGGPDPGGDDDGDS